ncbi:MAG: cytochrome c3 family protein [Bdellovibrio sp.]|nr:cytochrome c3 family protein [Bdellovibrio sp.]
MFWKLILSTFLALFVSTPFTFAKEDEFTCTTCHSDVVEKAHVHRPVKLENCKACHVPTATLAKGRKFPDDHPLVRPNLGDDPKKMCLQCHSKWGSKFSSKKNIHSAIEVEGCLGCHHPHGSDVPKLLKITTVEAKLCVSCHNDKEAWKTDLKIKEHKIIHQKKGCLNCHDPHSSNLETLLLKQGRKLCLSCHDQGIKTADGRTLKSFKQEIAKDRTIHSPVDEGEDCSTCHLSHASVQRKLLKDEFGEYYDEFSEKKFALCFTCHDADLVTEAKTSKATEFRNGEVNLHNFHVMANPKNRGCGMCHEVHSSKNPTLIKDHVPYKDYKLPQTYKKMADGGSCVTACHGLKVYERKKPFTNPKGR